MSVLVTGGAGYIGSHMVWGLLDAGEKVVVLDNLVTGFRSAVAAEAAFVEGDVGDTGLVARIIAEYKVGAVLHFAGSVVVPDSVADPLGYYHNNTANSRSLIAACVAAGVPHFIFSSTAAVYGIPDQIPVSESAQTAPISPYGASKLMTEWMLRDTAAVHDLTQVTLRYFNVAGADPAGRTGQSTRGATHLIKVACETALGQREHLQVFGRDFDTPDGTGIRDYIHVADLVQAHLDALRHLRDGGSGGIFNCGYGHGYSVLEVVAAVERASGAPVKLRDAPRRPGDSPAVVAAAQKIRECLGWQPCHDDLAEIVSSALQWERALQARIAAA